MLKRRQALNLIVASATMSSAGRSFAQAADTYPSRPVTIVHQYTPGGTTDILARLVGEGLQKKWGQPFLVDSKPGGAGIIGASHVANSKPDGHTLLLAISAMSILPAINKRLPFDVEKSFVEVVQITALPFVAVTSKKSGITSIEQLISYAKENPNKLTCGSIGLGSPHHLALELFNKVVGVTLRHVAYKGASAVMNDVMSGHLDMAFVGVPVAAGFIEAGTVNAVVVTGAGRSATLPKTPTMVESGYPQYTLETWYGLMAPAGTPADIIDKLYRGVSEVVVQPEKTKQIVDSGMAVSLKSPGLFTERFRGEVAMWKQLVAERGIETN